MFVAILAHIESTLAPGEPTESQQQTKELRQTWAEMVTKQIVIISLSRNGSADRFTLLPPTFFLYPLPPAPHTTEPVPRTPYPILCVFGLGAHANRSKMQHNVLNTHSPRNRFDEVAPKRMSLILSKTELSKVRCETNLQQALSERLRVSSVQLAYMVGFPCCWMLKSKW